MHEVPLFLRAKPWQTLIRLYESLSLIKLDWASHQPLTTTPSSAEPFHPLFTFIKEDLCLLSHLLTFNKFKTLIMGISKLHHQRSNLLHFAPLC